MNSSNPRKERDEGISPERKDYNFRGHHFQEDVHLEGEDFDESVDFRKCVFHKNVFFSKSTFHKEADFSGAQFLGEAVFQETKFLGQTHFSDVFFSKGAHFFRAEFSQKTDFSECGLEGRADFYWAKFFHEVNFSGSRFYQDVDFFETKFKGNAYFNAARFFGKLFLKSRHTEVLDFSSVSFSLESKIEMDMGKAKFHKSTIQVVDLTDCLWPHKEIIYEEELTKNKEISEYDKLSFSDLKIIYRNLKVSCQRNGDYGQAGKFHFREMEMKRKSGNPVESFWWFIVYLLCGYGERLWRVVGWAAVANILFAFSYLMFDGVSFTGTCLSQKLWQSFYFSVTTFTTLGYGDFQPANLAGQVLALAEALIGAFFIALFVVIFARKMAR